MKGEWGALHLKQQDWLKARATFEEMREQAEAMHAPQLVAQALFGLAQVMEQEGSRVHALTLVQESRAIFTHLNHMLGIQEIECWLAHVEALQK